MTSVPPVIKMKSSESSSISESSSEEEEFDVFGGDSYIRTFVSSLVWPSMITVPLLLTSSTFMNYQNVFPKEWYEYDDNTLRPKPLGLILGIVAVLIGQMCTCTFFYWYKYSGNNITKNHPKSPLSVQTKGAVDYHFWSDGLYVHICQPEGFGVLGSYLAITWLFGLLPECYYNFHGSIQYDHVFICLLLQDCIQYIMHRLEHDVSPAFYQCTHKYHHKFINPKLFDSFNGSIMDTVCMILIPLYATAMIMSHSTNVWTYMAFGSIYANWLTLIHSEYMFPWDSIFHSLGFGTSSDHHVHHKYFIYNYGHLFMYWDIICGTYRNPKSFGRKVFNL